MIVSKVEVKNWRNFRSVCAELGERAFLVGPNASGKSNFLDIFRFLRDIAQAGGGLQKAVRDRDGVSKLRCLAARQNPNIEIDVELRDGERPPKWRYRLAIGQEPRGDRRALVVGEGVWADGNPILQRPNEDDKGDPALLTQTHLEQISANARFREIARFFESVLYLHVVPQLVRHPREFSGPGIPGDPYGRGLLQRMAETPARTREARLRKIEKALRIAVPQLRALTYLIDADEGGVPHLEAVYEHWRLRGAKQRERDFSDGTLRLIGLLWALLEGESLLLLEEPELSLHAGIVRRLPALMHRATAGRPRQILISTHSYELLSDKGIDGSEVLLLRPVREGTQVVAAAELPDVRAMLESGLSVADAALPQAAPPNSAQMDFAFP